MPPPIEQRHLPDAILEYLIVDRFLHDAIDARALQTAFEVGLIDRLDAGSAAEPEALAAELRLDGPGLRMLLALLTAGGVIEQAVGPLGLTGEFRRALRFRDLLTAKLEFANLVAADFLDLGTALLFDPGAFQARSRLFRLFDYRRAADGSPEAVEATRRWVRFTTALTRHEAPAVLEVHDFADHRRWLDVGGNSGEFALQICRRRPELHATVADLPAVCRVGRSHLGVEPEAARIRFFEADALADPLPGGFDLVSFKSVLHDWPEAEAARLLARGASALRPGGTLLIFERGPLEIGPGGLAHANLPMLLFFRSFRSHRFYTDRLTALGFINVKVVEFPLEMKFIVVSGRKPG